MCKFVWLLLSTLNEPGSEVCRINDRFWNRCTANWSMSYTEVMERYLVIGDGEAWIFPHFSYCCMHHQACISRPKELITINGWVPTFWWTNGLISGGENITTQGRYGRCECTRLCGIYIQPGTVLVCVWHEIAVHLSVNEASQMIVQKSHCCTITQLKISGL